MSISVKERDRTAPATGPPSRFTPPSQSPRCYRTQDDSAAAPTAAARMMVLLFIGYRSLAVYRPVWSRRGHWLGSRRAAEWYVSAGTHRRPPGRLCVSVACQFTCTFSVGHPETGERKGANRSAQAAGQFPRNARTRGDRGGASDLRAPWLTHGGPVSDLAGSPWPPDYVSRRFKRLAGEAGRGWTVRQPALCPGRSGRRPSERAPRLWGRGCCHRLDVLTQHLSRLA
jgi:hypothetical protein